MNQIVGLIMSIVYVIIYVAINVYRFSKIAEYLDFRFKSKQLYTILFWGVRVLVIAGLTCFMFLTFQEYVMFCYAKMIVITLILFVILVVEILSLYFKIYDDDDDYYDIVSKLFFTYFIVVSCIGTILFCFSVATSYVEIDDKIEVKTIYPITASDQNVVNGKVNGTMFGIHGYVKQDKLMYFYYYLSDDGKEVLYGKSDEKNTKRVLIDEGKKPYIELTTITKQYYKVEEKERVIYDGSKNVKTTIYAPLSAYTGISFDAK